MPEPHYAVRRARELACDAHASCAVPGVTAGLLRQLVALAEEREPLCLALGEALTEAWAENRAAAARIAQLTEKLAAAKAALTVAHARRRGASRRLKRLAETLDA